LQGGCIDVKTCCTIGAVIECSTNGAVRKYTNMTYTGIIWEIIGKSITNASTEVHFIGWSLARAATCATCTFVATCWARIT